MWMSTRPVTLEQACIQKTGAHPCIAHFLRNPCGSYAERCLKAWKIMTKPPKKAKTAAVQSMANPIPGDE